MDFSAVLELAAISGIVGFGAYSITCAVHVWHRRNAKLRDAHEHRGLRSAVRRTSLLLLSAGLLGMALSAGWQVIVRHEGLITGDGLFTVLRPVDMEIDRVTEERGVDEQALLMRYHSPDSAAEIAVLKLHQQRLDAEKQILLHEPLAVDPEIAQRLAELNAQERTLRTRGSDLLLEKRRVLRATAREKLVKTDEVHKLHFELRELEGELKEARSGLKRRQKEYERCRALHERNVVTEEEFSEKANKLESQQIEVAKLEEQWQLRGEQKAELERGLQEFLALNAQQVDDLTADVATVEDELKRVTAEQKTMLHEREKDLARAGKHRDDCLKKVVVELKQLEEKLAGWHRKLEVRAPLAGKVVYRASSPGSVLPGEPLIVLAPAGGLRFDVRLPRWMAGPLEHAGGVACELLEDLERDEQRRFIESRFSARLARWKDLPDHPGYGLAALTCAIPPEAVRRLGLGEQIAARLVWRPPLYLAPAFLLSAVLAGVGCIGWGGSIRWRRGASAPHRRAAAAGNGHGAIDTTLIEFGAEGAMLRTLGTQLRNLIVRGELDPHVIAAAEWALDRHRARAVRLLSLGLGDTHEVREYLEQFMKERSRTERTPRGISLGHPDAALDRLIAILRAIAPDAVQEKSSRLKGHLPEPKRNDSNGHDRQAGWHGQSQQPCSALEPADR